MPSRDKIGLIMLAMGRPESTEQVGRYLYNIFSDRTIIRLPGGPLMQKPLASVISHFRKKKVAAHYELIGGSSPLKRWTELQLNHVITALRSGSHDITGYIGMRYSEPSIEAAVAKAYSDGCRRFVFLPMYPQYCRATTGSSFMVAEEATARYDGLESIYINDFHDSPNYIALMSEYIDNNIAPDETLLFSAHSIPQKFVDDGDPYVDQTKKTASLAAGNREYFLAFQSRSGPVTWVGPDTVEETRHLLSEGRKLFVVPISFVCDHIETLYELDIELPALVGADDGGIRRMPMFNDDFRLARTLADIVHEKLNDG